MMLVFGRSRLVESTIDLSCCNDTYDAAAVCEDVLTRLPDISSPPSPAMDLHLLQDVVLTLSLLFTK